MAVIIESLSEKYKRQVVVLIDEYDVPVSENINNPAVAESNSEILKEFYSALKKVDKHLHFVFVVGVTRYAFMGLSAGLNQLKDLSLDEKYAGICGFTYYEVENSFREHLPIALKRMKTKGIMPENSTVADLLGTIKQQYDGYSWDGQTMVLNPFSVINCLDLSSLGDFWLSSGPSAKFIGSISKDNQFNLLEDKSRRFEKFFLIMLK